METLLPVAPIRECVPSEPDEHFTSKAEARAYFEAGENPFKGALTKDARKTYPFVASNIKETISLDPAKFAYPRDEWHRLESRRNLPYVRPEFSAKAIKLDEYTTRILIVDEDQLPLVTADIDLYDNPAQATEVLSFIAANVQNSWAYRDGVFQSNYPQEKIQKLLDFYPEFTREAGPIDQEGNNLELSQGIYVAALYKEGDTDIDSTLKRVFKDGVPSFLDKEYNKDLAWKLVKLIRDLD